MIRPTIVMSVPWRRGEHRMSRPSLRSIPSRSTRWSQGDRVCTWSNQSFIDHDLVHAHGEREIVTADTENKG